ncbi:MAG: hypothetical protein U0Q22_06310 [Acidimicrobiales bacterium]
MTTSGTRTENGAQASVGTQNVIPTSGRTAQHGNGAPKVTCTFNAIDPLAPIGALGADVDSLSDLPAEVQVWRTCRDATGRVVEGPTLITTNGPGAPRPDIVGQLRDQALANIDIELPVPRFSPPTETLPNLDTWFWTDDQTRQEASASAGGVTVTVTAELRSTQFEIAASAEPGTASRDDGVRVACPGAMPAYRPEVPPGDQSTTCHHRFAAPTRDLSIDVTSTWALSWSATNGTSGDLGAIERTSTAPYRVQAKRTVIRTPG